MFEATPNLRLPYLYVGQAQKEIIHNEALAMLDAVMFASLESELIDPPANLTDIDAGRRWLVGATPSGSWAGHAGEIAYWTGDGWRFVLVPDFCRVFRADLGHDMIRQAGSWVTVPPVNAPTGGAIIDQEARSALSSILSILRTTGLIPTT
jgi:hypothetical protein